ncbi:protoglobin domain-containing protein [Compostibacillus humi]|uniref:protoglobin domain-containing protein n=1 Tax=Compostibacillus humi TaxID=1245525 RepID=UPI0016657411|nr:protoglobin domain-containing protein [Compostibacillus humi]
MQLKLTNMTKEDLAVAQCLKPYIEENIQEIMEKFYDNIEQNPDLRAIINKHSSTDKLKKTLRRHITEMFSGVLNTEFMEKRKKNCYCPFAYRPHTKMVYRILFFPF